MIIPITTHYATQHMDDDPSQPPMPMVSRRRKKNEDRENNPSGSLTGRFQPVKVNFQRRK